MEIVTFENQTFREIPEQDNPAYIKKSEWTDDPRGCLMIVKQDKQTPPYTNVGRYVVLMVIPCEDPNRDDSIYHVAQVWHIEDAKMFAEVYRDNYNEEDFKKRGN
jgi:hypothetical protein